MKIFNYITDKGKIIDAISAKNISLSCIIGENGSGKTKIIKDTLNKIKKEHKCLYVKSEFDQKKLLNELEFYINEIMDGSDKELIVKKYKSEIKLEYDEKFHNFFLNDFISVDNKTIILNYNDVKKAKIPSGIFLYSVLKTISILLKITKREKGIRKFLLIDEIEKYAHISLINKISKIIISLMKYDINIILTTHSHYQLEMLWTNFYTKYNELENEKYKFNLFHLTNHSIYDNNFHISYYDKNFLKENLLKLNYREVSIVFRCFFSKNIFLVEGLRDNQFVHVLMKKYYDKYYYDIVDCFGKQNLIRIYGALIKFNGITPYVLIDGDDKMEEKFYLYGYHFKKDLEYSFKINSKNKSNIFMINEKNLDNLLNKYENSNELLKTFKIYLERET